MRVRLQTLVRALVLSALVVGAPLVSGAQVTTLSPRAQVIQRAQQLVNDGNGADGRALMDSLLNAIEPRSSEEAEVLFWRATLAESWDQAQRDYLRVMLEHERSSFAASAMLRLAQGELMRGDRDAALRFLDRLLAEAPDAPERTEAAALRARLMPVAVTTAPVPTPVSSPAPTSPPATPPQTGAAAALVWSVQIGAFPSAADAATFAATMREKGYDTRVDGIAAPYRVRVGRYATRAAAAAAMEAYRRKERADAFLTQVPRP